jgi:hypothetical protein
MAHVTFVHGIGNKPEPRALLDLRAAIAQAGAQAEGPCEPLEGYTSATTSRAPIVSAAS